MPSSNEIAVSYAASCNPPRRAKRPRTASLTTAELPTPSESTVASRPLLRRARLLPKEPLPELASHAPEHVDSDSADEDEFDPSAVSPAPKRRGRKPGTLSRSARESMRKLNHSRIEKARRTKINETLTTLSVLVNEAERQGHMATPIEDIDGKPKRAGKGKAEEKEFKLDVLVKTVAYMQHLIERVKTLESARCPTCAGSASGPSLKRKRLADEVIAVDDDIDLDAQTVHSSRDEDSYVGDDERGIAEDDERLSVPPMPAPLPARPSSAQPNPSPRLPPISSWLPHPYVDPSCIAALAESRPQTSQAQLPSPPPSGRFHPVISLGSMPALVLPAPAHPILPQNSTSISSSQVSRISIPTSARRLSNVGSPAWTPEDESAASLLLQMSSSPTSAPSSMSSARIVPLALPRAAERSPKGTHWLGDEVPRELARPLMVETPSSLLATQNSAALAVYLHYNNCSPKMQAPYRLIDSSDVYTSFHVLIRPIRSDSSCIESLSCSTVVSDEDDAIRKCANLRLSIRFRSGSTYFDD
ncbi:hypothetical protein A0H81_03396 [Grifola frondosa]|uniref:BHLH domain-containing protein n=1 Tax=Grifola frondosa TaxID=5627 RepID=A0A1C7MHC2_GRIFR|nr:hypothetical protein A0H81_03396 [Grifola frondosa]